MSSKILIILACVPLYVVNSFCDKYISSQDGNKNNVLYNGIKFLICSIILLPMALMDWGLLPYVSARYLYLKKN